MAPQDLTGVGLHCHERGAAVAGEHEAARSRKHTAIRRRVVRDLPLPLECHWIDRSQCARPSAITRAAAHDVVAELVLSRWIGDEILAGLTRRDDKQPSHRIE